MISIKYKYKGQDYTVWAPESWADIKKNYVPVVKALFLSHTTPEAFHMVPLLLCDIPKDHYLAMTETQAVQLAASFAWLGQYTNLPTAWLVPKIETKHILARTFWGPADKLKNLIFEEFIYAESMLDAYHNKKSEQFLNQFIAILYRPKGFKTDRGDIREPFNKHTVEARAKTIETVDMATKHAIVLNYLGCKSIMPTLFKSLFSANPPTSQSKSSFSWLEVAYRLADHKPSEIKAVKSANLYDVLANLDTKVKDNETLKKEVQAQAKKYKK